MISDLDFVMPDDVEFSLPSKAGNFYVRLDGGISTRLYLTMLKYSQSNSFDNNTDAVDSLKELALKIIREDKRYKDMTIEALDETISGFFILKQFVTAAYKEMSGIVNQPSLRLPDLGITGKQGRKQVNSFPHNDDHEIMSDIAFVMTHTALSFQDIMDMPYITFAALLKNIVLSEALKNPEYREAYELHQMREARQKMQEAIKNGTYKRQTHFDMSALQRFAANL